MKKSQIILNQLQEILDYAEATAAEKVKTGEIEEQFINSYKYGYLKMGIESTIERYGDAE